MKTSLRRVLELLVVATTLLGCRPASSPPPAPASSCAIDIPGPPLDAGGRADGLYAVQTDTLGHAPLVRLTSMTWESRGSGPDGKHWEHLTVAADDAERLHAYTASAQARDVAMVLDGQVIARHKVRSTIDRELQVSCCDSRVCDRWEALMGVRQ